MQASRGPRSNHLSGTAGEVRSIPQVEAAATTTNILVDGGSWTLGDSHAGSVEGFVEVYLGQPRPFPNPCDTPPRRARFQRDRYGNVTQSGHRESDLCPPLSSAGADPIGKTFRTSPEPNYPEAEYQIVGVIQDTKYFNVREQPPPIELRPGGPIP